MEISTNEVLAKQNFITKIKFSDGEDSLSKDLRVKIMSARIEFSKIRKEYDEDVQEFVKQAKPDGFDELQAKENKTEEENKKLQEMIEKIESEYQIYVSERSSKKVNITDFTFTEDEFKEIVSINSDVDVDINGQKIPTPDFLEILYSLFVQHND